MAWRMQPIRQASRLVMALLSSLARAATLFACLLAFVGSAEGHAVMLESDPADGAVVRSAPARLVVRFNEPVSVLATQLLDAQGRDLTPPDAAAVRDRELRIALPPALAEGTYVASFRVMSIDGHPVGGSIVFSVGTASSGYQAASSTASDQGWRLAMAACRALLDLGLLGGAGGLLFLLLVGPTGPAAETSARIARRLALVGCCAGLLAIGIQGGLLVGGSVHTLAALTTWRTGLLSGFGRTAVTAALGLALVVAGLSGRGDASARLLAAAGTAIALASFALSGHVVTAGPRWLTVPAVIAHTSAVAFWVGSLLPLRHALGLLGNEAGPFAQRFSRIAVGAVALLVLTGTAIACLQVGSVAGLFTTTYGALLLAKLALFAGLLTLATVNKLRLLPALAHNAPHAAGALRKTIAAELALVIAIVAVTAGLGTTPPPRAQLGAATAHQHHAQPASLVIATAGRRATVTLSPGESGPNLVVIEIADDSGAPLAAQAVSVIAANPSAGVEPIRRPAERAEEGRWEIPRLVLVPAGRWSLRIDVLVSDFEKPIFEGVAELR